MDSLAGMTDDDFSDFNHLYNSVNSFQFKDSWGYVKTLQHVIIFKTDGNKSPPKNTIIIKISSSLKVNVWVEDTLVDINLFWTMMGCELSSVVNLKYSMINKLINFLDINPVVVMNKQQKWKTVDTTVMKRLMSSNSSYCRICFKEMTTDENFVLDEIGKGLINAITEVDINTKNTSLQICETCAEFIEELTNFRDHILISEANLTSLLQETSQQESNDQLILIKHGQPIISATPSYVEEEWREDDEASSEHFDIETEINSPAHKNNVEIYKIYIPNPELNVIPVSSDPPPNPPILKTNRFKCQQCSKSFNAQGVLNKHIYRVHSQKTKFCQMCKKGPFLKEPQLECALCSRKYLSKSSLMTHFKKGCNRDPNVRNEKKENKV